MTFKAIATKENQNTILANQNAIKSKQSVLLSNQNKVLSSSSVNVNKKVIGQCDSENTTSYRTAHLYNGSGVLRSICQFYIPSSSSGYSGASYIKVTIDDVVVIDNIKGSIGGYAGSLSTILSNLNIRFENYLKIEHKKSENGYASTFWQYDKD